MKKGGGGARHATSFEALLREEEESKQSGGVKRVKVAGGSSSSSGGGGREGEEEEGFVPARLSRRILVAAKEQAQEEGETEQWDDLGGGGSKKRVRFGGSAAASKGGARGGARSATAADAFLASRKGKGKRGQAGGEEEGGFEEEDEEEEDEGEEEEEEDELAVDLELEEEGHGGGGGGGGGSIGGKGGSVYGVGIREGFVDAAPDFDASGAEAAVLARFMPEEASKRRTLADVIMEKLAERSAAAAAAASGGGGAAAAAAEQAEQEASSGGLDPRIIQVYTDVGRFLSSYKAGKVPKVFKVIPSLPNWEEVLFLTNPDTWTPHATYAATRIFVSNLNASKAQRFNALVLLPKCRDDIFAHKRLNFHLYLALRKAAYKPGAFYKGLLLPLAGGGDCTLREALIVGSVLARESIPLLHSAAALIRLCAGMPYSGAVSVFLRYLLNKKYSLPHPALAAAVAHFASFAGAPGPLPLIWHQALLALAQRYKGDLSAGDRGVLLALCSEHVHAGITPEVRRELAAAAAADTAAATAGGGAVGGGAVGGGAAAAGGSKGAAAAKASAAGGGGKKGRAAAATMDEY